MKQGEDRRGRWLLIIIALLFLFAAMCIIPMEASARVEARYLMRAGDTVFGNDLFSSRSIQTLFHQESLSTTDIEHYDMDFPVFTDGIVLGPTVAGAGTTADGISLGAGSTANVLPFGPVNLAFPSIRESVLQTVTAKQTGFFQANYNYRPEADFGNVPLTTDYPFALRQAICPAPLFGGLSLYPEQFDTWWVTNRMQEINKSASSARAAANRTAANQTAANQTATNQTTLVPRGSNETTSEQPIEIPITTGTDNVTITDQIKAPDLKPSLAIEYFKPKNASTKPWEMPAVYPEVFNLAGRDHPVFPNPGIGTFSTNGAGSTGASLTGIPPPVKPTNATGNQTGNKTKSMGTSAGSQASAAAPPATPAIVPPAGYALTYANFNFDATTEQINRMSILERMWRNSHRGGTMGKAYIGDTSAPNWIDPYDRPNDLSMLDEHWYCLQSALNMVVPGTQIMPRFWSLGYL